MIEVWKRYLSRYRAFRWSLVGLVILLSIQSMIFASIAYFVKVIFDVILSNSPATALLLPSLAILLCVVASGTLSSAARWRILGITKGVVADMRRELLCRSDGIISFPASDAAAAGYHSLAVHDTERIDVMSNALAGFVLPAALTSVVLTVSLAVLSPLLFSIILVAGLGSLLTSRYFGNRLKPSIERFNATFADFSRGVLTTLARLDLSRVTGTDDRGTNDAAIDVLRSSSARMSINTVIYNVAQSSATAILTLCALTVGGFAVKSGALSLGALAAFYVVVSLLANALNSLWTAVPQVFAGYRSLQEVDRALQSKMPDSVSASEPIALRGEMEFCSVSFSYSATPVLRNVSIRIAAGDRIAIVGPNGAGKSTLLYLALGLRAACTGSVLVDGVPIEKLSLRDLRQQIGVVLQEPNIFDGTVSQNIAFGKPGLSRDDIENAAKLSGADVFIRQMPFGFETKIGDTGVELSGGQKQLVAVARALAGKPALLLLDEPTSQLDAERARALLDRLQNLDFAATIIMITHDLTVGRQWRTYRLNHGTLVECEPGGSLS